MDKSAVARYMKIENGCPTFLGPTIALPRSVLIPAGVLRCVPVVEAGLVAGNGDFSIGFDGEDEGPQGAGGLILGDTVAEERGEHKD